MNTTVVPALSVTRRRILTCIRSYAAEHGYAPTVREIGDRVGLSASTVAYQLKALHSAGWISKVPGSPRALSVRDPKTGGV